MHGHKKQKNDVAFAVYMCMCIDIPICMSIRMYSSMYVWMDIGRCVDVAFAVDLCMCISMSIYMSRV